MNFMRGLIRLWVFVSVMWVVVVGVVMIYDPRLGTVESAARPENPYAKYAAPAPPEGFTFEEAMTPAPGRSTVAPKGLPDDWVTPIGQPASPTANPDWMKDAIPAEVAPRPLEPAMGHKTNLITCGAIMFGPPAFLLALGMGIWWVATGFKSTPHS